MATTTDYLTQLQRDKQTLVDNLVSKGVSATSDETFTSLVPKVAEITSGDGVTISNASYLFSTNARLEQFNELLSMCKNVDNTTRMFDNASELTEIDLTNLDVSNVTSMYYMFNSCINLTQVNVSNFNTSKVTNFSYMFAYCSKLTEIDLSSFYTSNTANTSYMFRSCSKLAKIIINNPNVFRMSNVNMLENTPIKNGTGYVYVPDDLVETYKTTQYWSTYANQIKGMSELPKE